MTPYRMVVGGQWYCMIISKLLHYSYTVVTVQQYCIVAHKLLSVYSNYCN